MACSDSRVTIEGELPGAWLEPVLELCDAMIGMPDIDSSARVRVVAAQDGILLEVTLADGRSAIRRVRAPERLHRTVEALLTVPPALPERVAQASPTGHAAKESDVTHERAQGDGSQIEVGAAAMTRLAGPHPYAFIGGSAYAGKRTGSWLLGMTTRWDALEVINQPGIPGFELEAVGAGFLLARRVVERGGFALDTGGSVMVVGESEALVTSKGEDSEYTSDLRFGGMARACLGHTPLRFTIGLDAELSPTRIRRTIRLDPALPRLPTWSVGLALGATWSTQ